jgi:tetratricopeptide (TPR) repeat protein
MATGEATNPREEKAKTFFQYGNDAAMKSNFDYAIQMYKEACKLAPDNLLYRQALRGIARRKFGNEPSKVGRLVGARLQPIRMSARSSQKKGKYAEALATCEDGFTHNPWDIETARIAADAAEGLGLKDLAAWLLEAVHAQGENDGDFLRHEARIHELNESWAKAIACWERVKKVLPNDQEAGRKANEMAAKATIKRSGLGEALDERARRDPAAEAREMEMEEMKRRALTPEQRALKEIEENPKAIGPYVSLADTYKLEGRLDEAEQILAKGIKANPDDNYIKGVYADVQIQRMKRAIDTLNRRLQKAPADAEAKVKLEQLTAHLSNYEIKELRRRAGLRPDDMNLRLLLGQTLAKAGKHDEAIAEYQKARQSPPHAVQANLLAGQSFEANGAVKLAERHYQDALRAADPTDHATVNNLHYRLGRIAESQGNKTEAEEHYNEVAANDYGYLDVAQRLRDLNKKVVEED